MGVGEGILLEVQVRAPLSKDTIHLTVLGQSVPKLHVWG